jgi:hypothetical protein
MSGKRRDVAHNRWCWNPAGIAGSSSMFGGGISGAFGADCGDLVELSIVDEDIY